MMKRNSKLLRTLSVLAVIALVCLGLALHTGTGTPSAWGIYDIAAICPLGAAEAAKRNGYDHSVGIFLCMHECQCASGGRSAIHSEKLFP